MIDKNNLPKGWGCKKLGEVCDLLNGRAYKRQELLSSGKYKVLRVGNLFSNNNWYFSDLELDENKYCGKGDLLYAWSASFGPYIWNEEKTIYHYHIWKVNIKENIDKKYMYYYLLNDTNEIKKTGHGVAMIHVTKSGMEKRNFIFPIDKNEQEFIVDALDTVSEAIRLRKEVIEQSKELITSIFHDMFGDPITNLKNWDIKTLGNLCDVRDGTHDSPKMQIEGYPLVTSKNLVDGKIDFNNVGLISKVDFDKISKRSYVNDGDIIFAMIGTIGNPIIVKKEREFAIKNVALIKFSEETEIKNLYLKTYLEEITDLLLTRAKGSTQKFVSLGFIRKLEIFTPPLPLQEEFAKKAMEIEDYIKTQKEELAQFEELFQSLLQEAFNGNLTAKMRGE
jgi:type I restriction enzyme S subunit